MFEQNQRFSIRKLAYGAASVIVATFILGNTGQSFAETHQEGQVLIHQTRTVPVYYLNYSDLNEDEKTLVVTQYLQGEKAIQDGVAFLVYQSNVGESLPKTGLTTSVSSLIIAGTGILIGVYAISQKRKHLLGCLLLGFLIPATIVAQQSLIEPFLVDHLVGEPSSTFGSDLEHYQYIGYIDVQNLPEGSRLRQSLISLVPEKIHSQIGNMTSSYSTNIEPSVDEDNSSLTNRKQSIPEKDEVLENIVQSPESSGVWEVPSSTLINEDSPESLGVWEVPSSTLINEDSPESSGVWEVPSSTLINEDSPESSGVWEVPSSTLINEDSPESSGVWEVPSSTLINEDSPESLGVWEVPSSTLIKEDSPESSGIWEVPSSTLINEDSPESPGIWEVPSSTLINEDSPESPGVWEVPSSTLINEDSPESPGIWEVPQFDLVNEEESNTTDPLEEYKIERIEKVIPFEEERIEDNSLWQGEEQLDRQGENGLSEIQTAIHYLNGEAQPNPTVKTVVITSPINKVIRIGTKPRTIPTIELTQFNTEAAVSLTNLVDKDVTKKVDVTYTLSNTENSTGQRYILWKNGQKEKEDELSTSLSLTHLEHDAHYRLELIVDYDIGEGIQSVTTSKEFILELKKIEIKDVKEYKLFKRSEQRNVYLNSLSTLPEINEISNYFVEVLSNKNKTIVLPVSTIEESEDGYKITITTDDLVEKRNGSYEKGHDFIYPRTRQIERENGIRTFADLIRVLNEKKDDVSAVIELTADVSATEVDPPMGLSYVDTPFKGTLNGNGFVISDIVKPLFGVLSGAKINNLILKDADIVVAEHNAGILSGKIENGTIIDGLEVSGKVAGLTHIGGVTGVLTDSTLNNIKVSATISRTQNVPNYYLKPHNKKLFGGIAGYVTQVVNMENAYVDILIRSNYGSSESTTGGLFGKLEQNTRGLVNKVYITGTVDPIDVVGYTGGIIGDGRNARTALKNIISTVDVKRGNLLRGVAGNFTEHIYVVDSKTGGKNDPIAKVVTEEEAIRKRQEMGITPPVIKPYEYTQTYATEILHQNVEKFLPFYNVSQIEKYAQKLAHTERFTLKKIVAILPTNANGIVSDYSGQSHITGIMVHFEDGTIEKYQVHFKEDFNPLLKEYIVPELGVLYTPEGFVKDDELVTDIATILNEVNTTSYSQIDLEDQVEILKGSMHEVVRKLLSTDKTYFSTSSVVAEQIKNKIRQHKDDVLKGLSYLTRWYSIQFGELNVGDLLTYNQRFFGKNVDVLDTVIRIGRISRQTTVTNSRENIDSTGLSELKMAYNVTLFKTILADNLQTDSLLKFLETLKDKFTNYETMEEWFKATTAAYIEESSIGANAELSTVGKTYAKLSRAGSELNYYILPLLTAKEGIYMIVSPAAISVGMAEKYMNLSLKETNPEQFVQEVVTFKEKLERQSNHYQKHYTFWYNLINDQAKKDIERDILSVDSYFVKGKWRDSNSKTQAMKDFFSPMQLLINNNYSSAYANGSRVHFVTVDQLSDYGSAIYSHEMVHNNDGKVYFNNGGRRNNIGAEYYATGMFQVPDPDKPAWDSLGLNTMFDHTTHKNHTTRTQVLTPERLDSAEKVHSFMKRTFDVLYTLDYAEAQEMLLRTAEDKKKWYAIIQTKDSTEIKHRYNSQNIRVELPDDLQLHSIADLVRNEVISRNGYGLGSLDIFKQDGTNKYYYIRMFEPIYATGENTLGAAGDIMFRRMAFELLAYKGYTEGMLPYISNNLNSQKPVGKSKVTDDFVIQKVSNNAYQSMAEFKIDMFEQRYAKRHLLRPVTIIWKGNQVEITNYDKIRSLIKESLDSDLQHNSRDTKHLKNLIYTAYLNLTNDFVEEIYD